MLTLLTYIALAGLIVVPLGYGFVSFLNHEELPSFGKYFLRTRKRRIIQRAREEPEIAEMLDRQCAIVSRVGGLLSMAFSLGLASFLFLSNQGRSINASNAESIRPILQIDLVKISDDETDFVRENFSRQAFIEVVHSADQYFDFWSFDAGSRIETEIVFGGNWLFFGTSQEIIAVDGRTGALQWRFSSFRGPPSTPIARGEFISFHTSNRLYVLFAATGELVDERPYQGNLMQPFSFGNFIVGRYFGQSLAMVDRDTGNPWWTAVLETGPSSGKSGIASDGNSLVFNDGTNVISLDIGTGRRQWSWSGGFVNLDFTPTISDGTVFVYGVNGLSALRLQTQGTLPEVIWMQPEARVGRADRRRASITVDSYRVYGLSAAGEVLALSRATGELLWRFRASAGISQQPLAAGSGQLLVASQDGNLIWLDAETGEVLAEKSFHAPIIQPPLVCLNNRLFVALGNGQIRAFQAIGETTADVQPNTEASYRSVTRTSF